MTDKKSNESRRKLLKSIAAGSGAVIAGKSLPDSWSRPVVDSVMLPAHAQTSAPAICHSTIHVQVTDDKKQKIPSGSSIPSSTTINIGVSITPNPGIVTFSEIIAVNGNIITTPDHQTDSNGVYTVGFLAGAFSPNDTLSLTYSYECTSVSWSVNFT